MEGSCWRLVGGSGDASCEREGGAGAVAVLDTVRGVGATSASPSRRGELGGGVSDDCRGMGEMFCTALPDEKGGAIETDGTEGELPLLRARGSESLAEVEIAFHDEKWSLFCRASG